MRCCFSREEPRREAGSDPYKPAHLAKWQSFNRCFLDGNQVSGMVTRAAGPDLSSGRATTLVSSPANDLLVLVKRIEGNLYDLL